MKTNLMSPVYRCDLPRHGWTSDVRDCPFCELSAVYAQLSTYLDLAIPKVKPSCLVCGRDDYDEPAIRHLHLGSIVVCHACRNRAVGREGSGVEK